MEYADYIAGLKRDQPALAAEFDHSDSLESVLGWLQRQKLPAGSIDLVAQDEFSYDLLIRLEEQRWLVFGVN